MRVLTVGWSPRLVQDLLPIDINEHGFEFINAVVDEAGAIEDLRSQYPQLQLVALGAGTPAEACSVDLGHLASLEAHGVPTVRAMIVGDPYLREIKYSSALGYASFLARRLAQLMQDCQPDVVLASHDRIHSGMALAIARSQSIPFVALTFTSIPSGLMGFCKSLNPDALVPIQRPITPVLYREAERIVKEVRESPKRVADFRNSYAAPVSLRQYAAWWAEGARRFARRSLFPKAAGISPFTAPRARDSIRHRGRRSWNRATLPVGALITSPPSGPYVFHTLHMAPESTVDAWAPWYQDQMSIVKMLAISVPVDVDLVVKLHYADPDNYSRRVLNDLIEIKGVQVAAPDSPSYEFIAGAALVTGITGTACLEAALLGKPVVMFGDSPYLRFPNAESAGRPASLPSQIARLLSATPPSESQIADSFVHYLGRYLPGVLNDWSRPVSDEARRNVANAFLRLEDYITLPAAREMWYHTAPFSPP